MHDRRTSILLLHVLTTLV